MYTIIPLLLAHIQELNKQILFLFKFADETYTKVKGSKRYVWFIMDAIKKSILGYRSSDSRDTTPCILAMRMAFDKFKTFPGKALKFVADGYTAYKLAEQQFALHEKLNLCLLNGKY